MIIRLYWNTARKACGSRLECRVENMRTCEVGDKEISTLESGECYLYHTTKGWDQSLENMEGQCKPRVWVSSMPRGMYRRRPHRTPRPLFSTFGIS